MHRSEPLRYGYFGPQGTFTQMALASWLSEDQDALAAARPFGTVALGLDAVRSGEIDRVMVPIENSVEGGVSATLDALNSDNPLVIQGEVLVPITFVLAARSGTTRAAIRGVGSHSHAWPQVRGWMAAHLPDASYVPTLSTAAAAEALAAGDRAPYEAAVCAPMAAEVFGLEVLAEDIGDNASAVTRFVVVSRPGAVPAPTGSDKTTVVLYQHDNHPGGLMELLEQFAARGINLTRLESRPTGSGMGAYCFSIDFEGHVADERVGETLMSLRRVCADIRFHGSYRRADGRPVEPTRTTTDQAFEDARTWLHSLRA
ncbi:prephenate dehydratase [Luteipulveratus mongoliensis]|uniref:Prephenate dehydratase n=1 Tax=Luteipulveratus mongoliensis TaxID=571913 RepID=A0A0K1JPH3_9MICO|nr:prephenate dehydratase [Luteipulveratus mongoliensis]AKU18465.1 prephenate dehydratase [Luteipulveratus mongoliensis]